MSDLPDSYHLSADAIWQLATLPLGGLQPKLDTQDEPAPYTALDNFDQALRGAGQLLLHAEQALVLVNGSGESLTQAMRGPIAFPGDVAGGAIKDAVKHLSSLRRLLPVGSGLWQQAVLAFTDEEQKTHCRVHLVFLTAEQGRAAAVAWLQGIKGYEASLAALRQRMVELGGFAFSGNALYASLFPASRAYDAKPIIPIAPDADAFEAANRIIAALIPIARANEPGIIDDLDTEFLHDYRIQLRKIRSVLSLFKGVYSEHDTSRLKSAFSAVMAHTGQLRDLDVYLLEKPKYYGMLPASLHPGLDTLYDMFLQRRLAESTRLAARLSSKEHQAQITQLADQFAKPDTLSPGPSARLPAHDYACQLIWKRYRKVSKAAAKINAETPDEQVHSLRIMCKKLRYLMEFFGSMFAPAEFNKLLRSLKKLQDNLGLFNDYSVQQHSLGRAMQQLPAPDGTPDIEAAQSIGALIAVLHSRQLAERNKVEKNIARFNSRKTRKAFKQLFQLRKDHT